MLKYMRDSLSHQDLIDCDTLIEMLERKGIPVPINYLATKAIGCGILYYIANRSMLSAATAHLH